MEERAIRIKGVQRVLYGVEDMAAGRRFWTDFGLIPSRDTPEEVTFATPEGAEIVLRPADHPSLPSAPVSGSTAREVTWGVADEASLRALAEEFATDGTISDDGARLRIRTTDPAGHAVAFEMSRLKTVAVEQTSFNAPGQARRIDRRAPLYGKAAPIHMAHVVYAVQNLEETTRFYRHRAGFRLTDSYPGHAVFLRCSAAGDHHNLFLLSRGGAVGFHHVAFDVRDIHEVFGGGLHMTEQGWETHIGPGRHPISSAYFWYFKNPCGGAAEYDFDTDFVTDAWEPREFEVSPDAFAEWASPDGVKRFKSLQTARV